MQSAIALQRRPLRFMVAAAAVILVEALALSYIGALHVHLPGNFQLSGGSTDVQENIDVLIKAVFAAGAIWMLFLGHELHGLEGYEAGRSAGRRDAAGRWLAHGMALFALALVRSRVKGIDLLPFDPGLPVLIVLEAMVFAAYVHTALLLVAPIPAWGRHLRDHRGLAALVLASTVLFSLLLRIAGSVVLVDVVAKSYYDLVFPATVSGSAMLLRCWGYSVSIDFPNATIAADGLEVSIASSCLGYEGMTMAFLALSAYLWIHRARFRFPAVLSVFPVVFAVLFLANIVRIALLVAIGASWSLELAMSGFHRVTGWIYIMIVLSIALVTVEGHKLFANRRQRFTLDLSGDNARLLPQVLLIALAMFSLLFTTGFDWLYPARTLAICLCLVVLWPRLGVERVADAGPALGVGIAVFAVWLWLVPDDPAASDRFAAALWSVPVWESYGWMAFRVVGAAVIVPLAEELAFRGALLGAFEDYLARQGLCTTPLQAKLGALMLTSAIFGGLHSAWAAGMLAGLAYGALRLLRGRVVDAVIAHGVTNLLLAAYVLKYQAWSLW